MGGPMGGLGAALGPAPPSAVEKLRSSSSCGPASPPGPAGTAPPSQAPSHAQAREAPRHARLAARPPLRYHLRQPRCQPPGGRRGWRGGAWKWARPGVSPRAGRRRSGAAASPRAGMAASPRTQPRGTLGPDPGAKRGPEPPSAVLPPAQKPLQGAPLPLGPGKGPCDCD